MTTFRLPHEDHSSYNAKFFLDFSSIPSMAQQQYKDSCDLPTMLVKFGQGQPMPTNYIPPTYGDYSGVEDYKTSLDTVRAAAENFMSLPARVRDRFKNDPQVLLQFLSQESNRQEAFDLGLVSTPPPPPPPPAEPSPA